MIKQNLVALLISIWSFHHVDGFHSATFPKTRHMRILLAKKKGSPSSKSKGFGKAPEAVVQQPAKESASNTNVAPTTTSGLQSVSTAPYNPFPEIELDPNLPPEERAKLLLAKKYGLRTLEEQQREAKLLEKKQELMKKQAAWQKAADADNFDIMSALPTPLLVGIDRFLKIGLFVTTVAFVGAGLGITAEAWQASSGNALPEDIDKFIVNVVEPNFTLGLGVLLGFSISLGIFATAQLGSASSVYTEDK